MYTYMKLSLEAKMQKWHFLFANIMQNHVLKYF